MSRGLCPQDVVCRAGRKAQQHRSRRIKAKGDDSDHAQARQADSSPVGWPPLPPPPTARVLAQTYGKMSFARRACMCVCVCVRLRLR